MSLLGHCRTSWNNTKVIDRQSPLRCKKKFSDHEQLLPEGELAGPLYTREQISRFSDTQTERCKLCDMPGPMEQQRLKCTSTVQLKQESNSHML